MLNIYTGRELIPKDMMFVNDNEAYFKNVGFFDRAVVEPILATVEQGQWREWR